MKIVKNISMQGFSVSFGTPEGVKTFFLAPKQQVEVPDKWKSKVAENLVQRRMVRMTHVPEATKAQKVVQPIVKTPTKKIRKSN